jgi:hypothetical protein
LLVPGERIYADSFPLTQESITATGAVLRHETGRYDPAVATLAAFGCWEETTWHRLRVSDFRTPGFRTISRHCEPEHLADVMAHDYLPVRWGLRRATHGERLRQRMGVSLGTL